MEIIWAILLGGASLAAVIAAGLRRVDRERRVAAARPPLSSATPKPEAVAPPPAPEPVAPPEPEPIAPPTPEPVASVPEPELPGPPPAPEPVAPPAPEPVASVPEPELPGPPPAPEPVAPPEPEPIAPPAPEPVAPPEPEPVTASTPPKLVVDPDDRELADIIAWGHSGQAVYLSLLSHYRYHPNAVYRCQTAIAIGAIAAANPPRYEILRSLDTLAQLSGDTEAEVRRAAVDALGRIANPRAVRLLEMALKDSDSEVVKTASAAIARFKTVPAPAAPPKRTAPARRPELPAES